MSDAAHRMDAMYAMQRHFYDLTRKPYLLGRDRVIRELNIPANGSILEIGCGTGRNLIQIAGAYPSARCFGLDVSAKMLETARAKIARNALDRRISVAQGDATQFDPARLFGVQKFDRVVISYALSMIGGWEDVLLSAPGLLSPAGALYIVDFGDQSGLPSWFRQMLQAWLARFSVTPRVELRDSVAGIAWMHGCDYRFQRLYRGYAALAEISAR